MQRWDAKKSAEVLTRTYILPKNLRDAGVTISSCVVSQAVYEHSKPDASPDVLSGSRQINAAPFTYKGQTIAISQAVLQDVKSGLAGCEYVVTFTMTLSVGGAPFVEDCIQPVTTYVPSP